ncbi:MAG: heavy metal translocating P-type ATPase [Promethearchaeota archaeon]
MVEDNYCVTCSNEINLEEKIEISHRKRNILIIIVSGFFLTLSILFENVFIDFKFIFDNKIYSQIFAGLVVIISGLNIIKEGIVKLLKKTISINLLMTIAAIGSFFIGHGGEGGAVMFLFFLVEFLEDLAVDRSKKSVTSLMKIAPTTAMVKRNGSFIELHTHDVVKGEIFQLKPGDSIPLDGVIVKGTSSINEASLTGESVPVFKQVGNEVYAGTINIDGYLEVEVIKTSDQTLLAKIQNIIVDARRKKANIENFIDKFAKYYTPIMIIAATSVVITLPLFFQFPLDDAIYKALIFLVISCPCALALSTPISIVSALTSGAKNGILIKGGKYIEKMNNIHTIAFDKTGTLTEGILEVRDIVTFNNQNEDWFSIAAGLETLSEHPISKAIIKEAKNKEIEPFKIKNFKAISGKGVIGEVNGDKYYLGNKALFRELGVKIPHEKMEHFEEEGKTTVLFGKDQILLGLITLQDKVRDESKRVITELKKNKIQTLVISGDNQKTVMAIQKKLDIDQIYYELKPDEKQNVIEQFVSNNKGIIMVGDGINDAPALATSSVGIAMGGIGSDVSLETADVILMKDNLLDVITLLNISKKASKIIKQNIYFALSVKMLFVILTLFGLMNLWVAIGIGDLGVTFAVILNAFRISLVKKYR